MMEPTMSMTLASKSNASATATTTASFVRVVAERTTAVAMALVNRWMVKQLCDFSDHELADIGLSRSDLHSAFDGPFHTDPSLKLSAIAHGNSMKMSSVVVHGTGSVEFTPLVRGREE